MPVTEIPTLSPVPKKPSVHSVNICVKYLQNIYVVGGTVLEDK